MIRKPISAEKNLSLQSSDATDIVISYVVDKNGKKVTVSTYSEETWDMSPFIPHAGRTPYSLTLDWRLVESVWVNELKEILYIFMTKSVQGASVLKPSSLNNTLDVLKAFTRWASSKNINSFSRLTPFNITDYINYLQKDKKLSPKVIHQYILCIDRIYKLRDHLNCSFSFKPWKGSAKQAAGNNDDQNESKTIPFTIKEASQLFNTSLLIIKKSEHYLSIRDEIHTDRKFKNPHQKNKHARKILSNYGIKSLLELNRYLVDIPAASYIIIALTTGCRAHEILDIRLDCLRKTTYHSEVFYWLHSYSYKANIGSTRWLAPGILLEVIEILEWYSRERRVAIKSRIRELTNKYSSSPASQKKEITSAISKLYNNANRIFLSTHRNSLKISSTTIRNMNLLLKNFTQKHSITLSNSIHTHMFRRTYAVLIVNFNSHSILTSTLRDHFKHSSILMTSSYTSLNGLDHELLKFIEKEEVNFKHAVISEWLDPKTKISGKSGDSFKSYRDKLPPILLSNFKEAVKLIASTTSIRSTGHAWCLSGKSDCSGQGGIYDLSHCATDCSYGLVDKNYIPHYESIYEQQIKLLELDDIGEGGRSKIKQEALRVIKILNNLKGL